MSAMDGVGSGRLPVVWLHGWGMSSAVWQAVPTFARHDSWALDLPGHGGQVWSESLNGSLDDAPGSEVTRWAEALLARAPERAVWVGWSLGGLLALEVARLAPERVAGLVLLASSPCFVAREGWPCAMSVETFAQFEAGLAQDHALTLRRFLALQTVGVDDAQRVRSVLNAAAVDAARVDVRALRAGLALLCAVDQREVLTALKTPVAVMLGGLDRIVPPCVVQAYQALCPGVRVFTQPRAGHAPFLYRNDVQNDGSDLGASLEWMQEVAR